VTWINPAENVVNWRALVQKTRVHFLGRFLNRQVAIGSSRTPPQRLYFFVYNPERKMLSKTLQALEYDAVSFGRWVATEQEEFSVSFQILSQ
jgi:hypothetical protein